MAKLTKDQVALQIKRKRSENAALKKKREIQEQKDLYGNDWRQLKQTALQKELEIELGTANTPKVADFEDRYSFFDPINVYKDADMKTFKIDFDDFAHNEEKYKDALAELDKELGLENKDLQIDTDGMQDCDGDLPDEADMVSSVSQAKSNIQFIITKFFDRYVPRYTKYICECCGLPKNIDDFYIVYDISCAARTDSKGNIHTKICKKCANKLLAYYYEYANKDIEIAMQYLCSSLNLYWDVDLFVEARAAFEKGERKGTLIGAYITKINKYMPGVSFMDSPFLQEGYEKVVYKQEDGGLSSTPLDWSKEDYKNKKIVIDMCGYDPFEQYDELDQKKLYKDLLNLLTDDMAQDYIKLQAGINVVQSFFKIRQITEKQARMEKEGAPIADQKALADLKAKELTAVSTYSRDNGLTDHYANAKARGEFTLSGTMRAMDEKKYEKNVVNKYDIQTSACIEQAAEASFKAIMSQLSFSDAEVWKITQDQFAELNKLRKENAKLEEDLRKEKYKLAQIRLEERAREAKEGNN